ncbi:MAG: bifunctional hydroxymethylpyrimidine kinase/phosphomethylpyrimidine kinase [Rubrivivax sp.]|nr:bifunctional hydroxymethylpyrimidine kinase/phosphomethylpyrimidine kinase [Pyrinomonadaceae bacterium]
MVSDSEKNLSGRLAALVGAFPKRRVLVVGDLVADQFVFGEISRVSREAPVMILRHERTETVPGGAANCAMNFASLGARAAIVGVVGDDAAGRALLEKLAAAGVDCGGVAVAPNMRTTTKQRVLAGHANSPRQQVIRLDYENESLSDSVIVEEIVRNVRERFDETDAVVVSDYNYGVACKDTLAALRALAANGPKTLLVDSRYRLSEFAGFTSATPNEDEVEHIAGRRLPNADELEDEAERLRERLGYDALLVTRGKNGLLLVERGAEPLHIEAVGSHDAVDVTGAGDTVIATFALALASGSDYGDAARLANHAGGLVVLKRGTACVYPRELLTSVLQEGE